ncbi:MAG TPA: FHA domain-containing protein [Myxococcaceae bacterium]|nr:FHA domain-containing protein [Myxococcaceae bacterium]
MHALMMLTGPREGQRVELLEELVLGRSPSCTLPVEDGRLSRRHARIWLEDGHARVEDLGSSNGTLVNGNPIEGPVTLLPGDRIQAGESSLLYIAAPAAGAGVREERPRNLESLRLEEVLPSEGLAAVLLDAALQLQAATSETMVLQRLTELAERATHAETCAALVGRAGAWVASAIRGAPENGLEVPRVLLEASLDAREVARAGAEVCVPLVASGGLPFGILYLSKADGGVEPNALGLISALARLAGEAYAAQRARPVATSRPKVELDGRSPAFLESVELAREAATGIAPIVFTGESGSGRAHLARWVHSRGARSGGPFIRVDCRGDEEEVEQTLFGRTSEPGQPPLISAFLLADGGTLLLECVESLSEAAAQRVARLLSRGAAPAPGGGEEPVDVRVMATASAPLRELAERGEVPGKLAEAFGARVIPLPPLRDRVDDLEVLFERFAFPLAEARGTDVPRLSPEALRLLTDYRWPHNVSELRLTAERLALLHPGEEIPALLLPPEVQEGHEETSEAPRTLSARVQQLERHAIAEALREAGGKKIRAAELLGISRPTLDKKIDDYALVVEKVRAR